MFAKLIFCSALCLLLAQTSLALPAETRIAQHESFRSVKDLFLPKISKECDYALEEVRDFLGDLVEKAVLVVIALPAYRAGELTMCVVASFFGETTITGCAADLTKYVKEWVSYAERLPKALSLAIQAIVGAVKACFSSY